MPNLRQIYVEGNLNDRAFVKMAIKDSPRCVSL